MWLVLANYEMSYASMVRFSDGFFTLMTYIMEMLFLFRFAGYVAGVGRNGVGSVLFFSAGATVFALSAPLVRLMLYLQQDLEAASAAGAIGLTDLAVGVLALTVSVTLCQSLSASVKEEPPAKAEDGEVWEEPSEALLDIAFIEETDGEEEPSDDLSDIELIEDLEPDEDNAE